MDDVGIKKTKLLTVSIAAYNTEQYIRKALDSLLDERVIDDLEIFVVDDGGTDHTLEIAQEYAQKYPGSVFPIHKENGGYGSVLNYTVPQASGKYFRILDGDDWLAGESLYEWVQLLRDTEADLVFSPVRRVFVAQDRTEVTDTCKEMPEGVSAIQDIRMNDILYMWCMTFKTSVLQRVSQRLPEHCLYTDNEFISYPVPYIETVYVYHTPIYNYRIGRADQSISIQSLKKHYLEHYSMTRRLMEFQKTISVNDTARMEIIQELVIVKVISHFNILYRIGKAEVWRFYKEIKEERADVIQQAIKISKLLRLFVYSHGMAYPVITTALSWRDKKNAALPDK